MRPIRGSVSLRRKIYPPKSCSSSTKKLTLLLPILRSSRELPNSEPAHFPARLPTSASSSQMKPRSGARWYVPPTSNRSKPPRIFHKSRYANDGNGGYWHIASNEQCAQDVRNVERSRLTADAKSTRMTLRGHRGVQNPAVQQH